MHVSYSEPYDDDYQYDYANARPDDLSNRAIQTVQNPYYGVDDTDIDTSQFVEDNGKRFCY